MQKRHHQALAALKRTYNAYLRFNLVYFSRGPVFLFYLVGVYYVWRVFSDFNKDTTTITNVAFGIAAAFSGLCFGWASSIEDSPEDKKRVAYCGERFLHAALLLVLASIIKYAVVAIGPTTYKDIETLTDVGWQHFSTMLFGVLVALLFFWALTFAHTGVIFVNRILWKRIKVYSDWDSWM